MYPPIEELIAHRDNMLLLDHVTEAGPGFLCATATAKPDAWYADNKGSMPAWIGIELMAQAIGAYVGLSAQAKGLPPKQGLLLGTRSYVAHRPAFDANALLSVRAEQVFHEDNGLAAFACTIDCAGRLAAEATLKVFEPSNFATFMEQMS